MNLSEIPPGGWQFHQPQTGWSVANPVGYTHDQVVTMIIKHRRANPAIALKHKLSLDPTQVSQELISYQQARGALPATPIPKPMPPSGSPFLPGAVAGAVSTVKKLASGAAALLEWEEAGMPHVTPEVASARAALCALCPKNQQGKSLTEYFTVPIADLFNKRFQKLQSMNLTTPYDGTLNVCQACLCPIRTKVWFPPELVLKRLKPEQKPELNQADPRCWILDI